MCCWWRIVRFPRSAFLVATLACFVLLFGGGCGFVPSRRVSLPKLGPVPDFVLTREDGSTFETAKSLRGKVWIGDFIFTNCPGPCPRMTQFMKRLQEQTRGIDELRFVSITVDPDRDTAPVLAAYAKRFGADPARWFFLTGSKAELHHLSKDVFKLGDVAPDFEHSTRFVLVDKLGRIRGYYGTSDASFLMRLIEDAKTLVKE
jgi:protein SCO1